MAKTTDLPDDPEAKAIATIISALAVLPEDRKLPLLRYIYNRFSTSGIDASQDPKQIVNNGLPQEAGDIKTFLKEKSPSNPYQQVAVLAYYLKKNEAVAEVNKKIIDDANSRALGRTIDKVTGVLNDAKNKYYFFGLVADGKKVLLSHGEDIVEALPDQKKVAELMKSFKKRRVKKNKKGKKK